MGKVFMKMYARSSCSVALVLAMVGSMASAHASSKDPAKAPARMPLNIRPVPEVPIPLSVFNIPSQPSEGRNPFYPQSAVRVVAPTIIPQNPVNIASFIVLNGITSPPKRTAMINGRTFEPGEEGEIKLPQGGRMLIKCIEIKSESATIESGGQRHELRLRSGL